MLDSRAVAGLGERNLFPGHVREWGHHVGLQGVRSVIVITKITILSMVIVGPVDDSLAGVHKNNSLGGCRVERFINRSVVSSLISYFFVKGHQQHPLRTP